MAATPSASTRGWLYDNVTDELRAYHGTTEVAAIICGTLQATAGLTIEAGGLTVTAGCVTLPAGSVAAAAITDDSLNADQVANVASAAVEGGIPVLYRNDFAAACCAIVDICIAPADKIQVIDAWVQVDTVDATETLTLGNGTLDISSALSLACAGVVRTTEVNAADSIIDPGACETIQGTFSACTDTAVGTLFVLAHKVA